MLRWIGTFGCLLVCSSAYCEEAWFQACGPTFPVRLEGAACSDKSRSVGFGGKNPATGLDWCCVLPRQQTEAELCEDRMRTFVEGARRGQSTSRYRYRLLKEDCAEQLDGVTKASGLPLPGRSSARQDGGGNPTPGTAGSPQVTGIGGGLKEREKAELADLIRFAIAVAPTVTKLYPPRVMPVDPGRSVRSPSAASSHPDVLRDLERRPSDISGVGGMRGHIHQETTTKPATASRPSQGTQPPSSGASRDRGVDKPASAGTNAALLPPTSSVRPPPVSPGPSMEAARSQERRSGQTDTPRARGVIGNAAPVRIEPTLGQLGRDAPRSSSGNQGPSLKGVKLELEPVSVGADLGELRKKALELVE